MVERESDSVRWKACVLVESHLMPQDFIELSGLLQTCKVCSFYCIVETKNWSLFLLCGLRNCHFQVVGFEMFFFTMLAGTHDSGEV